MHEKLSNHGIPLGLRHKVFKMSITISGQAAVDEAKPNAVIGICGERIDRGHLRFREFLHDCTILNVNQSGRQEYLCPNLVTMIFGYRQNDSRRSSIVSLDRRKAPM